MSLFPQILAHPMFAVRFWMGVGVILSVLTAFVICRFAERTFGSFALLAVFLILTARYIMLGNISLLEFPFVVLIAALYTKVLLRERYPASHRILVEVFMLSLIGSLARSDFGGVPLVFAGACAIRWACKGRREYLSQSVWGLIGATIGLSIVFLHNFILGGHILSGSAMTKALWGERYGYSIRPAFDMLNSAIVSSPWELRLIGLVIEAGVLVCAGGAILRAFKGDALNERYIDRPEYDDQTFLMSSGLAAVALYMLVYGFDPVALQPWYLANFVVPMVLVLGGAARWIESKPQMQASAAIALVMVIVPQLRGPYEAPWYHQSRMYKMAEYLQKHPVNGRIAGWNVGIVGYLLDGRVINLDGLMNNNVFPYIRDAKVEQYIDDMHIAYIVDYPAQMHYWRLAEVYGYNGGRLAKRLKAIHTETSVKDEDKWLDDTLYEVKVVRPGDADQVAVREGQHDARKDGAGYQVPAALSMSPLRR
jgi:hypothetical protein